MAERHRSRVVADGSGCQCAAAWSIGAQTRRAPCGGSAASGSAVWPGRTVAASGRRPCHGGRDRRSVRRLAARSTAQCRGFFADVLDHVLADRRGDPNCEGRVGLSLVDGSTVSLPGSAGSDWRLHARYETAVGRFTDLVITEARTAEALCCVAVRPGDVVVHDRGYARVRNFVHARAQGADFLTRIGWCSVRLFDLAGQSFDLLAALPDGGEPVAEHQVRIGHARDGIAARLIIARKPPEAIERQHARLRRRASRNGQKTDPRTLRTAGFMMLLTSLPGERANAAEVVRLYRMRWQIELAFKRLKSLGGFAALRARDPRLARSWLLAHLIAAVLIEASLGEALDSPP